MNVNSNHQNKYALVTGGNKGIGFAICRSRLVGNHLLAGFHHCLFKAIEPDEFVRAIAHLIHSTNY